MIDNTYINGININDFYNTYTLNIFSDASMFGAQRPGKKTTGCYGVVAVCRDDIIEDCYRLVSESTNNDSEIKGIRYALSLANKYRNNFKYINIFSDSQISILGLRDYIYKWRYNKYDHLLYTSSGTPVINQSIFIECFNILKDLQLDENVVVRIFHQSGHIDTSKINDVYKANSVFMKSNDIIGKIDFNFIRYISSYNTLVDRNSRSYLMQADRAIQFCDPISFQAKNKINRYY